MGEVRFHCFGACKADWDIYDMIMLRKKYRFIKAQQVWAEHLGVKDFKPYDGSSPCIPEPDETPEPDDTVGFAEPKKLDEKIVAALDDAANFYHAAYDWDAAGRNSIERLAFQSGGWVYYLRGLSDGQDPYELLKPVAKAISEFSLKQKADARLPDSVFHPQE